MKIYDYVCPQCKDVKEVFLYENMKYVYCSVCNIEMERMLCGPSVHLDDSFPGQAMKNKK